MSDNKYISSRLAKCVFGCVLAVMALSGCRRYNPRLEEISQIIKHAPDSAYEILSGMSMDDFVLRRNKAYYALLSTRVKHNLNMYYADSLMRYAEKYYESHGTDIEKCHILYCVGNSYSSRDSFSVAVNYYSKAKIYAYNVGDKHMIAALNNALGYCYHFQMDYSDALEHFAQSAMLLKELGDDRQYLIPKNQEINLLNALGRKEEAMSALYEAMPLAKSLNDTAFILRLACTEAIVYNDTRHMPPRLVIERLFDYYRDYSSGIVPPSHYNVLASLYQDCGEVDSARTYYLKSLATMPPVSARLGIYDGMCELAENQGDYKTALKYSKKFSRLQDTLFSSTKKAMIQAAEKKYLNSYLLSSYDLLQAKFRYQVLLTIVVVVVFASLVSFVFFFYRRRLRLKDQKIEEALGYVDSVNAGFSDISAKYESLKSEMGHKSGISEEMARLLDNRMESLKGLAEMASKYEGKPDLFYAKFKEYIKVSPQTNVKWEEDIIAITNIQTDGFIEDLRRQYPELSVHELCYCSLVCLGFSQQSIRILYDHTNMNSIYSLRTRIRSKLGMSDSSKSLDTYFLELLQARNESRKG